MLRDTDDRPQDDSTTPYLIPADVAAELEVLYAHEEPLTDAELEECYYADLAYHNQRAAQAMLALLVAARMLNVRSIA